LGGKLFGEVFCRPSTAPVVDNVDMRNRGFGDMRPKHLSDIK